MSKDAKDVEYASDPSKLFKQSPSDIVDTYRPDSEKHQANVLKKSLRDPNQATYSTRNKR
jgi:hypothetical protein